VRVLVHVPACLPACLPSLTNPSAGGIIHRDIKPSNICISERDVTVPVIVDFGTALLPDREDRYEDVATFAFCAPEIHTMLLSGDHQAKSLADMGVTTSADIWSLGLTVRACCGGMWVGWSMPADRCHLFAARCCACVRTPPHRLAGCAPSVR